MDTPLHPTQIYESAAAFLVFFFLLWLAPRKGFHGQVVLAYVALYSAVRFTLEFWRGDTDRGTWFGGVFSTSQMIALVLILGVAVVLPRVRKSQAIAKPAPA
jgi:phosphatidylglycerol:prolipoprotein diacylglycerol transferase